MPSARSARSDRQRSIAILPEAAGPLRTGGAAARASSTAGRGLTHVPDERVGQLEARARAQDRSRDRLHPALSLSHRTVTILTWNRNGVCWPSSMAASVRALCSQALGGAVRAGAAARQAQPVAHRAAASAVAAWRPLHDRRPFHVSRRAQGMFDGLKQQVPGQRWLSASAPPLRLPPLRSARRRRTPAASVCPAPGCTRSPHEGEPHRSRVLFTCMVSAACSGTNQRTSTWGRSRTKYSRTRSRSWSSARSTTSVTSTTASGALALSSGMSIARLQRRCVCRLPQAHVFHPHLRWLACKCCAGRG